MSKVVNRLSKFLGVKKKDKSASGASSKESSPPADKHSAAASSSSATEAAPAAATRKLKVAVVVYSLYGHIATSEWNFISPQVDVHADTLCD